jgi:hypothetical protein
MKQLSILDNFGKVLNSLAVAGANTDDSGLLRMFVQTKCTVLCQMGNVHLLQVYLSNQLECADLSRLYIN